MRKAAGMGITRVKSHFFFRSLHTRMAVSFLLVSILPLLLSGILVGTRTLKNLETQTAHLLAAKAENTRNTLDLKIRNAESQLGLLSSNADLLLVLEMYNQKQDSLDLPRMKTFETTLKNAIKQSKGLYETIQVSSADGTIVMDGSKHPDVYLQKKMLSEDQIKAMGKDRALVTDVPYPSKSTGKLVLPVTSPVWSLNGYLGSMTILFDYTLFMEDISGSGVMNQLTSVMNAAGVHVFHSETDRILGTAEWDMPVLLNPEADKTTEIMDDASRFQLLRVKSGDKAVGISLCSRIDWVVTVDMPAADFHSEARSYEMFMFLLLLGLMIPVAGAAVLMTRTIVKPVGALQAAVYEMSQGSLAIDLQYQSSYELERIRDGFLYMTGRLKELIARILLSNRNLKDAGAELVEISAKAMEESAVSLVLMEQLSAGAAVQVGDLADASKRMDQLSECIDLTDEHVRDMENETGIIEALIRKGADLMESLRDKSIANLKATRSAEEAMMLLNSEIASIHKITRTLENISSNTNLLALNASIEAARAGEHGLGFAVVAGEIRLLADQSAAESREIASLLRNISSHAKDTMNEITVTETGAMAQNAAANDARGAFGDISSSINAMRRYMSDIQAVMNRMKKEKPIVAQALIHIHEIADSAACEAQEVHARFDRVGLHLQKVSSRAAQLNQLADVLQTEVQFFRMERADGTNPG